MDLITNLKNLVEKCCNIKADERFVAIHLEDENDELVERPVTLDKSNSQKKSR